MLRAKGSGGAREEKPPRIGGAGVVVMGFELVNNGIAKRGQGGLLELGLGILQAGERKSESTHCSWRPILTDPHISLCCGYSGCPCFVHKTIQPSNLSEATQLEPDLSAGSQLLLQLVIGLEEDRTLPLSLPLLVTAQDFS